MSRTTCETGRLKPASATGGGHTPSAPAAFRYLSVCSGIEAASVAWHHLGWTPAAFSEIEKFPRAVLAHHYPDVPIHGDFTTIEGHEYGPIDLICGGTPCQSFSIAGLRGGMADDRGNLSLEFLRLAERTGARWVVWENVPGVLSSNGGRDFGAILGGLGELGYGFAYRILDAQYAGVPQRRRRIFLVGYLGDWRRAAAVLFERHSLQGSSPPRRETREAVAQCLTTGTGQRYDAETETLIAHAPDVARTLTACYGGSPCSDRGPDIIAFGIDGGDIGHCIRSGASKADKPDSTTYVAASAVRRLTPIECERLQGFPDNYTQIPWRGKPADLCPDGPRYKALGNSWAVPVARWVGERIASVESQIVNDVHNVFHSRQFAD